jgi:succinyl-CoA synthetase beta subunit
MQREILAHNADEAAAAAEQLGLPVALKIVSTQIAHKSDIGGVVLGLTDPNAVRTAYDSIVKSVGAARPDAVIDGVLVTPMAAPGMELIIGAKIDPAFGPVIMVGLGGVYVETLSDIVVRLAPLDHNSAKAMLSELNGVSLLTGLRGREPVDLEAVADCLVAVSKFAAAHRDDLSVVEINPVVAYPAGKGALALDAVLIGAECASIEWDNEESRV